MAQNVKFLSSKRKACRGMNPYDPSSDTKLFSLINVLKATGSKKLFET